MNKIILTLLSLVVVITGCNKSQHVIEKKTVFRTIGGWDNPPSYNGNPYAPGGVGCALDYAFGQLAIFNPLKNNYKNYLIEFFENNDGVLTIKLKKNIYWHDGIPFTSHDIKTNFIIGGAINGWTHIWDNIISIETPDDLTAIFKLKPCNTQLLANYILTEWEKTPYHIFGKWIPEAEEIIAMRLKGLNFGDDEFKNKFKSFRESLLSYKIAIPMGYGPYKVKKVTTSEMLLTKVESFPDSDKLNIDEILISRDTSNDLKWAQIKSGDIDITQTMAPEDVVEAITNNQPNIKMVCVPDFSTMGLLMNNTKYPFSDVNFRKALAFAINKDKVRQIAMFYGTTSKYSCAVLSSVMNEWISTKGFTVYKHNQKKTGEYLKKMGLKKDNKGMWCDNTEKAFSFEIFVPGGQTDRIQAAEEISRQLTEIGIKTAVRIVDTALFGTFVRTGKYDMAIDYSV